MRFVKVLVAAGLVAAVMATAPAWAAKLKLVDKKETRFGPVAEGKVTAQLADPDRFQAGTYLIWDETVRTAPGCVYYVANNITIFLIEPDPGEEVGDAVTISYTWGGGCALSVPDSNFSARAFAGGWDFHGSCYPLAVSLDNGATIVLNPAGSATQIFESPIVAASSPPNSNVIDEDTGTFDAVIGDTIELKTAVSGGSEWNAAGSGTVGGSTGSGFELRIQQRPVPTLGWVGLGALALLLAVVAAAALRR